MLIDSAMLVALRLHIKIQLCIELVDIPMIISILLPLRHIVFNALNFVWNVLIRANAHDATPLEEINRIYGMELVLIHA